MNDLAHLRELDNLSDLLSTHIIEVLPGKLLLLLNLPENVFGDSLVLSQRSH